MGDRPLRLFSAKWMRAAVVSATVAGVLVLPAVALGTPHPGDADFGYTYNAETQQIGFWFGPGDADIVCAWSDTPIDESILEAVDVSETHCFVVDIAGPNGQVNHGSIVSAFVSGLRDVLELSGYDGPSGQLISEIAKSEAGKTVDEDHGPPTVVEETKDSQGSKNKGTGVSSDTDDADIPDVTDDVDDGTDDSSETGSDEFESSDDTDSSNGDSNGKSDGKSNAGGGGNVNSGGDGSSNAIENAKGKGIGKNG